MGSKENKQLAKNYAQAIFESANGDSNAAEDLCLSLEALNTGIGQVKNAREVFNSPRINSTEKKEILKKLLGSAPANLSNVLNLLIDKQRFSILPEVQEELKSIIDKSKGLIHAEVSSAKELDASTLEKVKASLEKSLLQSGEKIKIKNSVEPKLIGGLKIKVKDLVYDGSIKSRLDNLKRRLG